MARNVVVKVTCDLCDDETEAERTLDFGFDGRNYEIDLCGTHLQEAMENFGGWAEAAQPASGGRRRAGSTGRSKRNGTGRRANLSDVREWARKHGYEVADRGRIPSEVLDAYNAAH